MGLSLTDTVFHFIGEFQNEIDDNSFHIGFCLSNWKS